MVLVALLLFVNQTKLNSDTYFLLEILEAFSNLDHALAFGDYSIASVFFLFLSNKTEPIHLQLKSKMIYCHRLQVLLVAKALSCRQPERLFQLMPVCACHVSC